MGFLEDLSGSFDAMHSKALNSQFGGGCPLCKKDNTLLIKKGPEENIVCGACGAEFKKIVPSGLDLFRGMENISLMLLDGDERYLGKTLPLYVWKMIRFLPEDDWIVAACRDKGVGFYATNYGLIREFGKCSFLRHGDIADIYLKDVWSLTSIPFLVSVVFLLASLASLFLTSLLMPSYGGYLLSTALLAIGALLLFLSRKQAYQIESPLLSNKELREWRLRDMDSPTVKSFVSVVKRHID